MSPFLSNPDVQDAIIAWERGRMSDTSLLERLAFLRDQIRQSAAREEEKHWIDVVYGEAGVM